LFSNASVTLSGIHYLRIMHHLFASWRDMANTSVAAEQGFMRSMGKTWRKNEGVNPLYQTEPNAEAIKSSRIQNLIIISATGWRLGTKTLPIS